MGLTGESSATLPLPEEDSNEPQLIGFFMTGAYQEILGDMHNLFGDTHSVDVRLGDTGHYSVTGTVNGDTVAEVLKYVNFDAGTLLAAYRRKFANQGLDSEPDQKLLAELAEGLNGYTYLEH